jgi:hypothetical protein
MDTSRCAAGRRRSDGTRDDEQAATAIARAVLTWSLSMLPAGQGSQ